MAGRFSDKKVKVGIYGTGNWANHMHIPNLLRIEDAEITAICDINETNLLSTRDKIGIDRVYTDAGEMLRKERLDVLFSCVNACARKDIEIMAADRGIHIFSEKPQTIQMALARAIDEAIRKAQVYSTVAFRERYRPIFQEAKRLLKDKDIYHVCFTSIRELPAIPPGIEKSYRYQESKTGGSALNWGCHAVDYARYMTGLNIAEAQAFYCHREPYYKAVSSSFNFKFSTGATMAMIFVCGMEKDTVLRKEPPFSIFFEGGRLDLTMYDRIEINGDTVYRGEEFNPWYEQDRLFIEAVRTNNPGLILNDYHDGLYSLAAVLAGWESSRRNGEKINVEEFMRSSP